MNSGRASLSVVLLLVVLSAACGGSQPPAPAAAPPPAVKTPEQRAAFYVECWRQFNDQNWGAFQNCYTEQAMSETVDSPQGMQHNRAAIIDFDKSEAASLPDRRGEVKLVLVNGSHLASIAIWTATNDRPMPAPPNGKPIPATHKKVGFYLAHTAELNETGALMTTESVYVDEATAPAQLGLVKAKSRPVLTPTGTPPTIAVAKNDENERKNVDAFKAMVDAFNKHDAKGFADVMADDYRGIDVTMPANMNKKQAIDGMAGYAKAFPDMALSAHTVWGAGDYVAAAGSFTGTNKGPMPGMGLKKPTGKPVSVRFFEVVKFENGKAKEDWTFFNGAAFASQLGMK